MTANRKNTWTSVAVILALALAACGGGGGKSGKDDSDDILDVPWRFLTATEGPRARIVLRTEGPVAVLRIEHEADRTPSELELTLGLDEALVVALDSVEVEDAGCPAPDVTTALEGGDLTVRITHPDGAGVQTDAATQEIRLGFEGAEATPDSISILRAGAIDDEGRPVRFTVAPTSDDREF